jgi:hypothetical protein
LDLDFAPLIVVVNYHVRGQSVSKPIFNLRHGVIGRVLRSNWTGAGFSGLGQSTSGQLFGDQFLGYADGCRLANDDLRDSELFGPVL